MATTTNNLAGHCIQQLFEAQVSRTPQAIAVVRVNLKRIPLLNIAHWLTLLQWRLKPGK